MDTPTVWKKALKLCGTGISEGHHDYTKMVVRKDGAYLPHTNMCKDWNCPYCSSVKSTVYGNKIKELTEAHLKEDRKISFITSTAGFPFKATTKQRIDILSKVFSKTTKSIKRTYGNFGVIKRTEFTINREQGFPHIHLHSLFFFGDEVNLELQNTISTEFVLRWEKNIKKEKLKVSDEGQRYETITTQEGIARYISKTISMEMTSTNTKQGKGLNWFDFLESDEVFSKAKKERIIRDVLSGTMGRRLITFSRDLNTSYKELEQQEELLNGGGDEVDGNLEEIEMLTSTANVLLKLHLQQGFLFAFNKIFTEDILHSVHTDLKFRMRFKMICVDTIEMRQRFCDEEDIVDYFLTNLQEITGLNYVGTKVTALPSPSIH